MGKFAIIIITIYILYYAGIVIYDLFLKKETVVKEESEEFSLTEFAENNRDEVKDIGIEDVENLNTPNSFNKRELEPSITDESEERQDLESWREKFESEQNIDSFHQNDDGIQGPSDGLSKANKNKWYQMLNLAETSVQLISSNDGYKIYQSMM
ncbi:hypothetical protein [Kaistella yonginensis]|uniref:hypothetical protein n=1 Tax=Kaistella yonginensis TaxID=658267 RepID=UPI0025B51FF9|nr:hypothetical protein [Kaistella yonginensis]MDN3607243.1 hypothetical protein [Kaistella yonginensis]